MNTEIKLMVRIAGGAYVTQTVDGIRASSTASSEAAATRFGQKYFGPAFVGVQPGAETGQTGIYCWLIQGDEKHFAWCWRTGLIEIGLAPPNKEDGGGPITIASGPRRALEASLDVTARHAYCNNRLLVPGVPEARSENAAFDALIAWLKWCARRNGKPGSHGVRYASKGNPL